jgi:hypothetical protein
MSERRAFSARRGGLFATLPAHIQKAGAFFQEGEPVMGSTFVPSASVCRLTALLTGAIIFAVATSALATSGVSPRFDGHYRGAATPARAMSTGACETIDVDDLEVRDGKIQPAAKISTGWRFDGFVTDEGFVSGHARMSNGILAPFEGRITENGVVASLSGGITEDKRGCAWLVRLDRD